MSFLLLFFNMGEELLMMGWVMANAAKQRGSWR